jgi:hypothetical protein
MHGEGGLKRAGTISFYGWESLFRKTRRTADTVSLLTVIVDVDSKYKDKMATTLALKNQGEFPTYIKPAQFLRTSFANRVQQKSISSPVKDVEFRLIDSKSFEDGCHLANAIPSVSDKHQHSDWRQINEYGYGHPYWAD